MREDDERKFRAAIRGEESDGTETNGLVSVETYDIVVVVVLGDAEVKSETSEIRVSTDMELRLDERRVIGATSIRA